jgi:hypothetical protein
LRRIGQDSIERKQFVTVDLDRVRVGHGVEQADVHHEVARADRRVMADSIRLVKVRPQPELLREFAQRRLPVRFAGADTAADQDVVMAGKYRRARRSSVDEHPGVSGVHDGRRDPVTGAGGVCRVTRPRRTTRSWASTWSQVNARKVRRNWPRMSSTVGAKPAVR